MRLKSFIKGLIFPPRCAVCGEILPFDFSYKSMYSFDRKYCYDSVCESCKDKLPSDVFFTLLDLGCCCISPFEYLGDYRKSVLRMKYHGYKGHTQQLGRIVSKALVDVYTDIEFDAVTYVPLTKSKQKARGYNQAQILARQISENLNITEASMLKKIKENKIQHELSAKQRKQNIKGVYEAINIENIKGKRILVTDDIVTTGYTLSECCLVLYDAGALEVRCVTVTKAIRGEEHGI